MKKQWTMIFASLVLMFTLTTAAVAQSAPSSGGTTNDNCRLYPDGTVICAETPSPKPRPGSTGTDSATSSSTSSVSWWALVWSWLTGGF